MQRCKSFHQAQIFVTLHAAVHNPFNRGRHVVSPLATTGNLEIVRSMNGPLPTAPLCSENPSSALQQLSIAGAGGAAQSPGMDATLSFLSVIGVPVAIDNAANAAMLPTQIIATFNVQLMERLRAFKACSRDEVLRKSAKICSEGAN